jgi:hypothetical protein
MQAISLPLFEFHLGLSIDLHRYGSKFIKDSTFPLRPDNERKLLQVDRVFELIIDDINFWRAAGAVTGL